MTSTDPRFARIAALAKGDHEECRSRAIRYASLVNSGDEFWAEEYACERSRLDGLSVQHALTHPSVTRIVPGSTGIGYGTQASLIETNRANGNLKTDGGGKLWRATKKPNRRTWAFEPIAMVSVDDAIDYL